MQNTTTRDKIILSLLILTSYEFSATIFNSQRTPTTQTEENTRCSTDALEKMRTINQLEYGKKREENERYERKEQERAIFSSQEKLAGAEWHKIEEPDSFGSI